MFQNPYFYPNYMTNIPFAMSRRLDNNLINGLPRNATRGIARNMTRDSLFSKISNSFGFFKNINWGGFINNASKTLGVINQTIPIVKQARPMFRNIKSVLKLASVFKDETDTTKSKEITKQNITPKQNIISNINNEKKADETFNNQPTFFIN